MYASTHACTDVVLSDVDGAVGPRGHPGSGYNTRYMLVLEESKQGVPRADAWTVETTWSRGAASPSEKSPPHHKRLMMRNEIKAFANT